MEFHNFEELLKIIPMYDPTTREDIIFIFVLELLKQFDLPLAKSIWELYLWLQIELLV